MIRVAAPFILSGLIVGVMSLDAIVVPTTILMSIRKLASGVFVRIGLSVLHWCVTLPHASRGITGTQTTNGVLTEE